MDNVIGQNIRAMQLLEPAKCMCEVTMRLTAACDQITPHSSQCLQRVEPADMILGCLQFVRRPLVPHLKKQPDVRHECGLLHLTDTTLDPGQSTVALLCYLTVQVHKFAVH